jgi:ATP-dependent Clp protease ATP-binding subunit ClpC
VSVRLAEHGLSLKLSDEARTYLADQGYDPSLGARPLRRVIQNQVEDALSEALLGDRFSAGDKVLVIVEDGAIGFRALDDDQVAEELENGEIAILSRS